MRGICFLYGRTDSSRHSMLLGIGIIRKEHEHSSGHHYESETLRQRFARCTKMDPNRFVEYVRLFGRLTLTWPPDPKISRRRYILEHCVLFTVVSCNILSIGCLFMKILLTKDDPTAISILLTIIFIIGDCCLQIILVRLQWPRLQALTQEVRTFLKSAKLQEKIVCRRYIRRYLVYQSVLALTLIAAITDFLCGPITLGKRFAIDAWYPFSTEPMGNRILVYVVEYMTGLQTLSLLASDCMVNVLFWYSTVRFKLLGAELHKARTLFQLRNCVRHHDELIKFVKETEYALSLLILRSLLAAYLTIITSGLLLAHNRNGTIKSQFFLTVWAGIVRLYGFSSAADDLTEMAASLSWAIYHAPAFGRPLGLGICRLIVIQRNHRNLAIRLWGVHSELSLKFFTKYSLKVLSFYMTLRVIVDRYV